MFCAFHKERLAHETCSVCGKSVCADCHRLMNGKSFCKKCFPSVQTVEKKYKPRSPFAAALLGIFPGLGQVYNGELLKGFFVFFTSWLVIPWLYGIYDAYVTACRINDREVDVNPSPALLSGCLLAIILIFGMFSGGPFFMLKALPYVVDQISGRTGQTQIRSILKEIVSAVESYQSDHHRLPGDARDLYFSDIPYLKEMYCGTSRKNYYFQCDFSANEYAIMAMPLKEGLPRYRMTSPHNLEIF